METMSPEYGVADLLVVTLIPLGFPALGIRTKSCGMSVRVDSEFSNRYELSMFASIASEEQECSRSIRSTVTDCTMEIGNGDVEQRRYSPVR